VRKVEAVIELIKLENSYRKVRRAQLEEVYPMFKDLYETLLNKHFEVSMAEINITQNFINVMLHDEHRDILIPEFLEHEHTKHCDVEMTIDEKIELSKDLFEVEMKYKDKQKSLNSKGIYIHFHHLMSLHRKLIQELGG